MKDTEIYFQSIVITVDIIDLLSQKLRGQFHQNIRSCLDLSINHSMYIIIFCIFYVCSFANDINTFYNETVTGQSHHLL